MPWSKPRREINGSTKSAPSSKSSPRFSAPAPTSSSRIMPRTQHAGCGRSRCSEGNCEVAEPCPERKRKKSRKMFAGGEALLVGGVNSPVRAFRSVGGEPLIIERAEGAHLHDADGNALIDFVGSWGAMIAGHAHPAVTAGVAEQARRGTSYGVTNELEIELAETITAALPSVERIRFVSSGTEATMSAVRVARAFTKRDFIVKFEGCYHGHSDGFLSQAGSGLATLGIASSPRVPRGFAEFAPTAPSHGLTSVEP